MKKRLKLVVLVSLILIIPFVKYEEKESNTLALLDYEEILKTDEVAKELEKNYGKNYKEVLSKNYEASEKAEKITNNMLKTKSVENNYPDYYGGMYINDNQDLVIKIVKSKRESEKLFAAEEVLFEYVEHSYNELDEVNNIIIDYFGTHDVKDNKLVANYIDIYKNKVIVELENNTKEEQDWFMKNIINSKLIEFKKGVRHVTTARTYNAGANINDACSVGYRAKLSGKEGFITVGHCFWNTSVLPGFGTGTKISYKNNGNIDAAFVENAAGVSITNTLEYSYFPTTTLNTKGYPGGAVGTIIVKIGGTTKMTSGSITNSNYSRTDDHNIYLTNLILTSAQCDEGDSGGVVFKPGNNIDKTGTVLGVVHGKDGNKSGKGNMIYSRADLIQSELGITRY